MSVAGFVLASFMVLVFCDLSPRLADSLGTSKRGLLAFLLAAWVGSWFTLPLPFLYPAVRLNLGGLILTAVGLLLLLRLSRGAALRCGVAIILTAVVVRLMPNLLTYLVFPSMAQPLFVAAFGGAAMALLMADERGGVAAALLGSMAGSTVALAQMGGGAAFQTAVLSATVVLGAWRMLAAMRREVPA